jgi:hypothetical protein
MGMVPARTVLCGSPCIGIAVPWGRGALCDRADSVHLVRIVLAYTVEMYASPISGLCKAVRDVNDDSISPVGNDCWSWDRSIDG